MTTRPPVGRCPACGEALSPHHSLIEYQTATGQTKAFAECPACARVDHPTTAPSMRTHDDKSHPEELPNDTLFWGFDDEDAPRGITILDPGSDITTHWLTIDTDYVCDLDESV